VAVRLAIISDTHFGDGNCALVTRDVNGQYRQGPKYAELRKSLGGKVNYLVLAGDVFDFSIASYDEAYGYARAFFQWLRDEDLAERIVYLAGNHDADMWYIQLHQVHVINRVINHLLPKEFRHSVPAIIDDRQGAEKFFLHGISRHENRLPYGGLFLDNLTLPATNFNFAFPNLYIVTDRDTVLVTHGQYLESYWSGLGTLMLAVAADDLGLTDPGQLNIGNLVQLNYPLNQLACTGFGQAGILTDRVVRPLEVDFQTHNLDRAKKYLDRLQIWLNGRLACQGGFCCRFRKLLRRWLLAWAKGLVVEKLLDLRPARRRKDFARSERRLIEAYYRACLKELEMVNRQGTVNVPSPNRIIYGHTHEPAGWGDERVCFDLEPGLGDGSVRRVTMHNTGGWLYEDGAHGRFCGAEVFLYETGRGFKSVRIY
jgi:predicted phosphodiesterase